MTLNTFKQFREKKKEKKKENGAEFNAYNFFSSLLSSNIYS